MDEIFTCPACGTAYLSPMSAAMCEGRGEAEARTTRHAMARAAHRDTNIVKAYD